MKANVNRQARTALAEGLYKSYAQVFFSKHPVLALCIMAVTFLHPQNGLLALAGVLCGNLLAWASVPEREEVKEGYWGFNHLLVSLYLSHTFKWNLQFVPLFLSVNFLCFSLTFWIRHWAGKSGLPYLSLPFILTSFLVMLSAGNIPYLEMSESGIYTINESLLESGNVIQRMNFFLNQLLPDFLNAYLKTLDGIFFDNNLIGGLLLCAGLLLWSRIAFLSGIAAFGMAWILFGFYGIPGHVLSEQLTGANFIFFTMTYMCYYLIPGIVPLLLSFVFFPLLFFLDIFLGKTLIVLQLKPFTLPFVAGVYVSLSALRLMRPIKSIHWVSFPYFSPEKNLYIDAVLTPIRKNLKMFPLRLPFFGQWMVSQGYGGNITHLGKWSKALDFVLLDEQMKTYSGEGKEVNDFYCYGKPVIAAASGTVVSVEDSVEENLIGRSNAGANWGNSIVIQHGQGFYTQVSHLKPFTAQVRVGDLVHSGQIIGYCGNSGRSPEPHLHFQVQENSSIGATTLAFPFQHFISHRDGQRLFHSYEVPVEGTFAETVVTDPMLTEALGFYPGYVLSFRDQKLNEHRWEVKTTAYNETFLYCKATGSSAFFVFDGTILQFTTFEGSRKSLLYYFFLVHYKMLPGKYPGIRASSQVSPVWMHIPFFIWVFDLLAPFVSIKGANYESEMQEIVDILTYRFRVKCSLKIWGISISSYTGEITVENNRISSWSYSSGKKYLSAFSF